MTTDFNRAMDAIGATRRRQIDQRLGPRNAASSNRGGITPIQQSPVGNGPDAFTRALQALPQPERPEPKPFGAGIPIVGGLIEHVSQGDSFGERAQLGVDWLMNDYKPTGAIMRTLGTTGALTAGALNEAMNPEGTPGDNPIEAAGQNVRNLWSWDRERSDPVLYNQDWLQALRERQTGKTPEERTGFDRATDFVGGLTLDILTDPLSFLGAGAVNRIGQGASRAAGHSARALGAEKLSQRAFNRANQLKASREAMGPGLSHRRRGPYAQRSKLEQELASDSRVLNKPVTPGTAQTTRIAQEAAEDVATARQVVEEGTTLPGQDIPTPANPNRPNFETPATEARDTSVFGDAQPGRITPKDMQQADRIAQDTLGEMFEAIAPRQRTAVSNAATPRKMRNDIPAIPSPFRSMERSVGEFSTPSLFEDLAPSSSVREWVAEMTPAQMEQMPTLKLYDKRPYSFPTLVRIADGDYNFGTAATRGPRGTRLTREEINGAQTEAQRLIEQVHREAVSGPRTAQTGPVAQGEPLALPDAPRPGSVSQGGGSARRSVEWEPVAALGGDWERISAKDWSNLQKRLKGYRDKGRITSAEYNALMRARKENDPELWKRTVDEIMYEGYPSPINTEMRASAENIPNADEIAEEAARTVGKGSPEMRLANDPTAEFTDGRAIRKAIHDTLEEEFIRRPMTHQVPTSTAARLTKDAPMDITVTGRYPDDFGRYSQYTAQKTLFREIDINNVRFQRNADGSRIPWAEQGKLRYDYAMPRLKAMMDSLEMQGIIPNTATDMRGFPMNIHDVLDALPEPIAINMFFHPSTLVPTSNILEAVEVLISHTQNRGSVESIRKTLESIIKQVPGTRGGGENYFSGMTRARQAAGGLTDGQKQRLRVYRNQRNKPKNFTFEQMVDEQAELYAQALIQHRPALNNRAMEKTARYSAEVNAETASISSDVIENALRNIEEGRFFVRAQTVENLDDLTRIRGHQIGAKTESIDRSIDAVQDGVAKSTDPEDLARLNDASRMMNAAENSDAPTFNRIAQQVSDDAAARAQEKAPAAALNDHDANTDISLMARVENITGSLSEKFKKNAGMEDIGDAVHTMRAVARPMRAAYRNTLNRATKRHSELINGRTAFAHAFDEIRKGIPVHEISNPAVRRAAEDVSELVDFFFPLREGEEFTNRFISRFDNPELINAAFAGKGYDHIRFDLKAAKAAAKEAGDTSDGAVRRQLSNQWRDWTISDPEEFLSVAESVLNEMATHDAAIRHGVDLLKKKGATSKKPRPGYVPLPQGDPSDVVKFRDYLPNANIYVHEAAAQQIEVMQRALNQTLTYNSPYGKWIQNNVLPLMNMWKTGMTIWNVRHWIRNFWGDVGLNALAGHMNAGDYLRAMRMMSAKSTYNSMWDGADALRRASTELRGRPPRNPNVKGSDVIVTSKNGISFTADELYSFGRDSGTFVSFPVRYDLIDDMVDPSRMQQFSGKFEVTGGRAKQLVSSAHEWRDHMVRGSHLISILRKGNWKNKQEALEEAARIVRHWHPDGSDLPHFESKYMRIAMPFYSWTRRALPLVLEGLVTNPHRVMGFPKAYYNAAEAMGVNLHSIADPFPVDQMFPEYLTDRIVGPVYQDEEGNYWGGHPGLPFDDLSQWLNDPLGEVIGMSTPAARAPLEMAFGSRLSGGGIRDMSDYLDSNIPFINTLSNFTGVSFTGTAGNVLTGNLFNTDPEGRTLDVQANVDRELKDHWDMTSALNWLTGSQIQNMSRENVISRAEFEERDRYDQINRILDRGSARRER